MVSLVGQDSIAPTVTLGQKLTGAVTATSMVTVAAKGTNSRNMTVEPSTASRSPKIETTSAYQGPGLLIQVDGRTVVALALVTNVGCNESKGWLATVTPAALSSLIETHA